MALEFDKSTSIQQNNLVALQKIETYILQQKEVATVFSNVGGPSTGIGSLGVGSANKTEFTIQLKSKKELKNLPTETFMKITSGRFKTKFPAINYSMAALGLIPRSAPIEITLSGIIWIW
jgi:HAE1 family hydrophobic/amphiphilic exporter-1